MKYPLRSQSLKDYRKLARGEIYRLRLADSPHLRSQISEETYNQIVSGELTAHDYITITCPVHGESKIELTPWITGKRGCKKCAYEAFQKRRVDAVRSKRPIPQHVIDRLQGSKDLQRVLNNEVRLEDKVEVVCEKHSYSTEVALGNLISSPGYLGCPQCRREARRSNMVSKFGVPENLTSESRELLLSGKVSSQDKLTFVCPYHGEYVTRIGDVLYKNVKCPKCAGSFTSGLEDRLVDALQKRGVQVVRNCRSIISSLSGRGLEIDLYLPQYRVGVEVNGLYFHSEQYMDSHRTHLSGKEYHKAKTDLCELVGVQLLHLWEDDLETKFDLCVNLVLSKCGLLERVPVGARKTKVVKSNSEFIDKYHIQGAGRGSVYALEFEGQQVSWIQVHKSGSSEGEYVLDRYCSHEGFYVSGGLDKLMAHVQSELGVKRWVSYADRCVSNGALYKRTGWVESHRVAPSYWCVEGGVRRHKFNYRLSNFMSRPDLEYREGLTEWELEDLNGIGRIWDAGKICYVKDVNSSKVYATPPSLRELPEIIATSWVPRRGKKPKVDVRLRSYNRVLELCKENGLELLQPFEDYTVDWGALRPVKCLKCGYEFKGRVMSGRTHLCPKCFSGSALAYREALGVLESKGWEPLFGEDDWKGGKEGTSLRRYPVRCKKCGEESEVSIYTHACPLCSSCSSPSRRSYDKYIERCQKDGMVPLFSFSNWKGSMESYPVKCLKCGIEFSTRIRATSQIVCPHCKTLESTQFSWDKVQEFCKEGRLSLQVSRNEWRGFTEYWNTSSGLVRRGIDYPFRCEVCGTEFHHKFNHGSDAPKCPICTSGVRRKDNTFIRFIFECEKAHLLPLVSESDWKGFPTTSLKYPVRCLDCGAEFQVYYYGRTGSLSKCSCKQTESVYRSNREVWLEGVIKGFGLDVVACDRRVLKGKELDLYVPQKGVAFEVNGMFFHSSSPLNPSEKSRNYHAQKTSEALREGVLLYHLWEDVPEDLILSVVEAKLGLSRRVYARNLYLWDNVPRGEASAFLKVNHVEGDNNHADRYIALRDETGKIYCCLSLLKRRIQSTGSVHWEIGRFANLAHYTVVGGYSRLLKCGVSYLKSLGVSELVSYANRDLTPDWEKSFYAKAGFEFLGDSGSSYFYWAEEEVELGGRVYLGRVPRQVCQKQKLLSHFKSKGYPVYEGDTERSLTERLGLVPIYNSGNYKFRLRF